jgi:hypothetical protein
VLLSIASPFTRSSPAFRPGRHPHYGFRGLLRLQLALRPAGSLDHQKRPLSRGFGPPSCPSKPLVSYQINRQLSGRNPPPLVTRAFGRTKTLRPRYLLSNPALGVPSHSLFVLVNHEATRSAAAVPPGSSLGRLVGTLTRHRASAKRWLRFVTSCRPDPRRRRQCCRTARVKYAESTRVQELEHHPPVL